MPSLKSTIGNAQHISLDDVCCLFPDSTSEDELGQGVKSVGEGRTVFCSKLSITRAEFSAAGQLGYKPEMMLVVDSDEYDDEGKLKFEGKNYSVYKTFTRTDGFTELYCEVKAGAQYQ